ncbi:MAG: CapA family protein [Chloroflexi bacterium]|jgi:poly-gamma-glutamate capsule biosynthesis protein CapA/YwtB (metallophosphatase superfamily)|nr:CapA family protein [Chloroflexota bacterium]
MAERDSIRNRPGEGTRFLGIFLVLMLLGLTGLPGIRTNEETPAAAGEAAGDLSVYPWVYLRAGQPLQPGETPVEVIAVGDLMPGRGVSEQGGSLALAAGWLRDADLTLGNLESSLGNYDPPENPGDPSSPYLLAAPPQAAYDLAWAGFDLLGVANNHTLDFGPTGLKETISYLQAAGIAAAGAGPDEEAAYRPQIVDIAGLRLAVLAINAVSTPQQGTDEPAAQGWILAEWDPERAVQAVQQAKQAVDVVLVSIHWGYEYQPLADPAQERIASALLAAGADVVLGHHPHVVQELEVREASGQLVAYSLGNFLFDQERAETRDGLALRLFFDSQGLRAAQALPVAAGLRPRLQDPERAARLYSRFAAAPAGRAAFTCGEESCQPAAAVKQTGGSIFEVGEIDLTGDGRAELVRREAEQVIVFDDGQEVWRSPAEWRVLDLALGDPNDDGRGELLLSLRKADDEGGERSHPFIIGFRGGIYRILWGGSAVEYPIVEVELGDLDGDGVQELVVIEEMPAGAKALSVWRWHGWGFSRRWRSELGEYRNLQFIPAQGDQPARLQAERTP